MNITDKFLSNILSIRYEDISPSAMAKLRTCLADTVSVALAGAYDLKEKEDKLLELLGKDGEVVSPIGFTEKTSLTNAILINGLSAHFLELDDGVRYGVIHPSAPLFAAMIPVAKVYGVDWKQFALGAICGYETSIRIASALQPHHYSAGYHPTATCCTLGVAVGIAVMLGYSEDEVKDAFSAATISACGSLKVLEDVSQLKPYNCGKAAIMGYISALMARSGFKGPNDALGGDTGFLKMMAPQCNENILTDKNDFFYVEKVYLKPYASCRHTHPEIEAAQTIRKNVGFDAHNIKDVHVLTYKGVLGKHDGNDIYGEASARMSIPYSIAISLLTGNAGIAEFAEPYVNDAFVLDLTKRIVIEGDEDLSKLVPDKRAAIVTVNMKDGRCYSERVDYPKGEPENPLEGVELYAKFSSMTSHAGMSDCNSKELFEALIEAETPNIKKL